MKKKRKKEYAEKFVACKFKWILFKFQRKELWRNRIFKVQNCVLLCVPEKVWVCQYQQNIKLLVAALSIDINYHQFLVGIRTQGFVVMWVSGFQRFNNNISFKWNKKNVTFWRKRRSRASNEIKFAYSSLKYTIRIKCLISLAVKFVYQVIKWSYCVVICVNSLTSWRSA